VEVSKQKWKEKIYFLLVSDINWSHIDCYRFVILNDCEKKLMLPQFILFNIYYLQVKESKH
jgi:hypothetical protein